MTLVSVIITVYNLEKYVDRSIRSVLEQSYRNLEIIVVDDCSTDASASIIDRYASLLTYVRTPINSGVLGATVQGLKLAKGEVICFLDGDDIWHADKIKEVVAKFDEDPLVFMASHDYSYIDAFDVPLSKLDHSQDVLKSCLQNPTALSLKMTDSIIGYRGHVWLGSAYSIRNTRSVVLKFIQWVNALPDVFNTYQDHPLATFWIVNHPAGRIAYVDRKLLLYRIHNNNYSGAYHDRKSALKIATKAYNTALSTMSILTDYKVQEKKALKRQYAKVLHYKYLLQLFQNNFWEAWKLNLRLSFTFYPVKDLLKEWTRYIGVMVLRDYFFYLVSKK